MIARVRALSGSRAQSASLIALAAFAVNQLRYLLDHDFLAHAIPLLLGFALAAFSAGFVRRLISGREPHNERHVKLTTYALGIAAVLCCQELLGGLLFACHVSSLTAIFSAGGWAALPLAVIFGVIAALIDRGIEAIEVLGASRPPSPEHAPLRVRLPAAPSQLGRRLSPLALGLAQRPPPSHT